MTTVLAYATLLHLSARFPELLAIVADWLADRTSQHWTARRLLETATWKHPLMEVRTATVHDPERTRWALRLKTRDARVPGRDWVIEVALGDREQGGVGATVIVQATDGHLHGLVVPAVPFSRPALVRALLERGAPDSDTPGLQTIPLETEADAVGLAARLSDAHRVHPILIVSRGETTLDVAGLGVTLTGLADVVAVPPVQSPAIAATFQAAWAAPPPGRAALFAPQAARTLASARPPHFGAEARALTAAVLKVSAPRVWAAHVAVDKLKDAHPAPDRDDVFLP